MSEHNNFVIFLKKINLTVNSLLEKYLNKLNLNNLSNIGRSNKVFLSFVALILLFLSYLSLPHIYNKVEIQNELESQLLEKFGINFNLSKNFEYKFFPRPHFIIKDIFITENNKKISDIKKLSIYVSLDNFLSLKNITIKDIYLENTTFNLNKKNSNFLIKLLDNNYSKNSLNIINSKIFFQSFENEILFINKIINMKYYYDFKELKNVVNSENEIFNIPYSFKISKDRLSNKIFSKINFNFLKLQLINEFDYSDNPKKGLVNFIYNKNKSEASFTLKNNAFNFNFSDKSIDPKFVYKSKTIFNPFYSSLEGDIYEIDISNFFNSNSLFSKFLKAEIFNNKNLNFDMNIAAKKFFKINNINNIILNFKIQEGLIDIDNSKFRWIDDANFEILNSLIYIKQNQLILDGKLIIDIKNYNEIYKFLQISKNSRPKLKKIEIDINYNFDEQIINLKTIKIDNKISKNINNILKKIVLKKDKMQNKIYLKNILKEAIIAYAG
jgi:hypothetical protein